MEGLPQAEVSEIHNNNKAAVLAYPAGAAQVNAQSFLQLAMYPITLKVDLYSLYQLLLASIILTLILSSFISSFLAQ